MLATGVLPHVREWSTDILDLSAKGVEKTGLPMRWQVKLKRIISSVERSDTKTLEVQIHELSADLFEELVEPLFLFVPAAKREGYEQKEPPFGQRVADTFPDAVRDIAAAGRCLALDEWTASVFHLMRVLEHGLHAFAKCLGVAFPTPIELENWKNIIDKIEAEIRQLEQLPKSTNKAERTKLYSQVACQFRYFKDAWRNHVSHSREHYDQREAETVWAHVRDFMQALVDVVA